jgi:hypothetical protein
VSSWHSKWHILFFVLRKNIALCILWIWILCIWWKTKSVILNVSPWHSKWHILHLSIRVKINIITYGIWPLLTSAKCVILNVTDSCGLGSIIYKRNREKLASLQKLVPIRNFLINQLDLQMLTLSFSLNFKYKYGSSTNDVTVKVDFFTPTLPMSRFFLRKSPKNSIACHKPLNPTPYL